MNKDMNQMDLENSEHLDQMVTEALMRDRLVSPDADLEWKKLSARMSVGKDSAASPSDVKHIPSSALRLVWTIVGTVAAMALIVVVLNLKGFDADGSSVYQAKATPAEIVILDEQDNQHVVKGNDLSLAPASKAVVHTVVVPEGKDMKLTLSDGTEVWLNANSRLAYPTVFNGRERKVELQGEAYFKVAHDSRHPFIVDAGGMQTRVLGTECNVDASDAKRPHVTLVRGSVKVSKANINKVIVPGEDAAFDAGGSIKVSRVDLNDVACWKDGIEMFDNASLRDIVMHMGSWYNVNVICHDDALLDMHLRYMYDRRQGIEEAVMMLNTITNNKIKLQNNSILIE